MFSFVLPQHFVNEYVNKEVNWGLRDAGGNSYSEFVFLRTYSRLKEDGTKEKWWEVCQRIINGMFSIQKDWCKDHSLPWNDRKAQATAQDAFDRLFNFKWTPPGRGIANMGTRVVHEFKQSASLLNCAFYSTSDINRGDPGEIFATMMEASMYGIGVGFDTLGADKNIVIQQPSFGGTIVIEDSKHGWVDSVHALINAYLKGGPLHDFDYTEIRPKGSLIKTFGGIAPGPAPLIRLHNQLRDLLGARIGQVLDSVTIVDIFNLIGMCVVSGGIRRTAEIALGSIDDPDFLDLKNYDSPIGRARSGHSWASNNSVVVNVGDDLTKIVDRIALNGEPGVVWLDTTRKYGRLADPINNSDHRVRGFNPCGEQPLESYELCTLGSTYLNRHDSFEDYRQTLKVAYLYAKTATLLPTPWPRSNAIMQRNRRIGLGMGGMADFADNRGIPELRKWMDEGYQEVRRLDHIYSEWLCVRESVKVTTVKPEGNTSALVGDSPGVHWTPGGEYFLRTVRLTKTDPLVNMYKNAGYRIEDADSDPETTAVIYFPIHSKAKRSERDVSLFEKVALTALAQRYWSDNAVSVTLSFTKEEAAHIGTILSMYDGQLKTVSFLPMLDQGAYSQMPYGELSADDYDSEKFNLFPVDLSAVYKNSKEDIEVETGCVNDVCIIKEEMATV